MPLSNQDVAIVAVCIAGIILAGIFAPGVTTIVSGVVSTLVGVFFVNRSKGDSKDTKASTEKVAPVIDINSKKGDPS